MKKAIKDLFDGIYRPYPDEIAAWKALGFTVPERLPREWITLGTVTVQDPDYPNEGTASVTVRVSALPARSWQFELQKPRMGTVLISTGSGDFEEMWKAYGQPFLDGMFSVEVPT